MRTNRDLVIFAIGLAFLIAVAVIIALVVEDRFEEQCKNRGGRVEHQTSGTSATMWCLSEDGRILDVQ